MSILATYLAHGVRAVREPYELIPLGQECPGSGVLVHEDSLDGNFVGRCGECRGFVVAEELVGTLRRVRDHRPLRIVRLAEMARDQAADEAVAAHIEARYEGVGQ